MGLGTGELILIGFVVVVVFSASRMGALGNAVGKFVYSFRKASRGEDFVDVRPLGRGRNGGSLSSRDSDDSSPSSGHRS